MTQEELDKGRERKPRNTTDRRPTMSELKSFIVLYGGEFIRAYKESEVDKVFRRLKTRLAHEGISNQRLEADKNNNWRKYCAVMAELRHSNRKRCLAMAAVCFEKSYSTTLVKYDKESGLLRNFYDWWGKRWLELAEEPTWAKFLQLIHKEVK